jgi:hypothetical protein
MTFIERICGLESFEKVDNPSLAYPLLRRGLEEAIEAIVRCIIEIQDGDSEPQLLNTRVFSLYSVTEFLQWYVGIMSVWLCH